MKKMLFKNKIISKTIFRILFCLSLSTFILSLLIFLMSPGMTVERNHYISRFKIISNAYNKLYYSNLAINFLRFSTRIAVLNFQRSKMTVTKSENKYRAKRSEQSLLSNCGQFSTLDNMPSIFEYKSDCYYLFSQDSQKMNWSDAKGYCKSRNTQLIHFKGQQLAGYLKEILKKRFEDITYITLWVDGPIVKSTDPMPFEDSCHELRFVSNNTESAEPTTTEISQEVMGNSPVISWMKPQVVNYLRDSKKCSDKKYFACYKTPVHVNMSEVIESVPLTTCNTILRITQQRPVLYYKSPEFSELQDLINNNILNCDILIFNTYPQAILNIEFLKLNLEKSERCQNSYLEVSTYDDMGALSNNLSTQFNKLKINDYSAYKAIMYSNTFESANIESNKYCGDWESNIKLLKFQSFKPRLKMHFFAKHIALKGDYTKGFGFKAYLEINKGFKHERQKPKKIDFHNQIEGSYSSSNYLSTPRYQNNADIDINIRMPDLNYRIEISFVFIDIEYQKYCLYDYISISDSDTPIKGENDDIRICGKLYFLSRQHDNLYYSSSHLNIFNDDTFNSKNDYFNGPNYKNYNSISLNNSTLSIVNLPKINFNDNDQDKYFVRSIKSAPITLSGVNPLTFLSFENKMSVKFRSDSSLNEGAGFLLKWKGIDMRDCDNLYIKVVPGIIYENKNEDILLEDIGNNYNNNMNKGEVINDTRGSNQVAKLIIDKSVKKMQNKIMPAIFNYFKSFNRIDIPYLKCATTLFINNSNSEPTTNNKTASISKNENAKDRILIKFSSINFDEDNRHTSCLEEYFLIELSNPQIRLSDLNQNIYTNHYFKLNNRTNHYNISLNNSNNYVNSSLNFITSTRGIDKYESQKMIVCPDKINDWNFKYFVSYSNVLRFHYIKNTRENYVLDYMIAYRHVQKVRINVTISINHSNSENNYLTTLNYPNPIPSDTIHSILLRSDEKANIHLYTKGLYYDSSFIKLKDDKCANKLIIEDPFLLLKENDSGYTPMKKIYCLKSINNINRSGEDIINNNDININRNELSHVITSFMHALILRIHSDSHFSASPFILYWELSKDNDFEIKSKASTLSQLPNHNLCANGGNYTINQCECKPPYSGKFCLNHPCESQNCNFGVCIIKDNTYACECDKFHVGSKCQYEICDANICNSQGICQLSLNETEVCNCYGGYTGSTCELKLPIIKVLTPSEKFFQEPFWMGIFLVIIVLIILGLIMLCQRKWTGEYKFIFCDDCSFIKPRPKSKRNKFQDSNFSSLDTIISNINNSSNLNTIPSDIIIHNDIGDKSMPISKNFTKTYKKRSNEKRRGSFLPLASPLNHLALRMFTNRRKSSPVTSQKSFFSQKDHDNFALNSCRDKDKKDEKYNKEIGNLPEFNKGSLDSKRKSKVSNVLKNIRESSNENLEAFDENGKNLPPPYVSAIKGFMRRSSSLLSITSFGHTNTKIISPNINNVENKATPESKNNPHPGNNRSSRVSKRTQNLLMSYSSPFFAQAFDSSSEDDDRNFKTNLYNNKIFNSEPIPPLTDIVAMRNDNITTRNYDTIACLRDKKHKYPPFIQALRSPLEFKPLNSVIAHMFTVPKDGSVHRLSYTGGHI
ncbi:uncharacterized protein LOC135924943 isoform X2 [Gordionus sp. m RMFG-2023]|uniref:uncharacterized protein LOC135924943 isoform X2 n=1 Tax=Gordionus sp. m RMFG-2023 TaxID=3053472 RepID=UPI0031FCCAE5